MFDISALVPGTPVLFGRPNGEKTLGEFTGYTRGGGKAQIKQTEARGGHSVGTEWHVPLSMVYQASTTAPPTIKPLQPKVQPPTDTKPASFDRDARLVGLPTDSFGKVFTGPFTGKSYRVVAINARNTKYPVLAVRIPDGKRFKFSVADVTGEPKTPRDIVGTSSTLLTPPASTTGAIPPYATEALIGRSFKAQGKIYTVTKVSHNSPKFPYIDENARMKFTVAAVHANLLPV